MMKVLIVQSMFGRWYVQPVHSPQIAWSGSRWVEHIKGVGTKVQVSNFDSIKAATAYAQSFGFEIVGIEQELI